MKKGFFAFLVLAFLLAFAAVATAQEKTTVGVTNAVGGVAAGSPGIPVSPGGFNHTEIAIGRFSAENLLIISTGNKKGTTGEYNIHEQAKAHFLLRHGVDVFGMARFWHYKNSVFGKTGVSPGVGLRTTFMSKDRNNMVQVYGYTTFRDTSPNKSQLFGIGSMLHARRMNRMGFVAFVDAGEVNFLQSGARITQPFARVGFGVEFGNKQARR